MQNRSKLLWFIVVVIGVAVLAGVWSGFGEVERRRADAFYREADALIAAGDDNSALIKLDQGIRIRPHAGAYRSRAGLRLRRNERVAALDDLNAAIGRDRDNAWAYHTRCILRTDSESTLDGAREDCDRAIELDPSRAGAFGSRGLVNLRQRRFADAWEDYNEALRLGGRDRWRAWRAFGRGLASHGQGQAAAGRQDIELAMRLDPGVAQQYAQFGLGQDVLNDIDTQAFEVAQSEGTIDSYGQYLATYPSGAHASAARTRMHEIVEGIEQDEAAARLAISGLTFRQARGNHSGSDSYGAIAVAPSTWNVIFVTDYASGYEAERVADALCRSPPVRSRSCDTWSFRNVCGALAISASDRVWARAWGRERDRAVRTALASCQRNNGASCRVVHSQCTPTPQ